MVVHNVGSGLSTVFPDLDGKKINDAFLLARPLVEFTWNMVRPSHVHLTDNFIVFSQFRSNFMYSMLRQTAMHPKISALNSLLISAENNDFVICTQIISHPNNLFEIMSKEPVKRERNLHNRVQSKRGSQGCVSGGWRLTDMGLDQFQNSQIQKTRSISVSLIRIKRAGVR